MEIRYLNSNDVRNFRSEIYELLKICFLHTYNCFDSKFINYKIDSLIEYIEIKKAYIFGALYNGSLVGFLWGYPINNLFESVFHIAYFAVNSKYRRKGIGRKLILAIEKVSREIGVSYVELIVGKDNHEGLNFYMNVDYKPHRYIMRKKIVLDCIE